MRVVIVSALTLFLATQAPAATPPPDPARQAWIKLKCAFCHGEDGAGNTDQGKKAHVPDLRSEKTQKLTDEMLAKSVNEGHAKMPSFKTGLTKEQVRLLISYIRRIAQPR